MAKKLRRERKTTKQETTRLVSKRDLLSICQTCDTHQNRIDTASGHIGELIKQYSEKRGLHRGAFRIIQRWRRMARLDSGKLWLELAHLDDYRQKLSIDKTAQSQGQLLESGAENVVALTRGETEEAGAA